MVTELVTTTLLGVVGFIISLLPLDTISWPNAANFGPYVGGLVGPLDSWLPVTETVTVMALTITVVLPALFVYRLSMWLWTLLPDSISGAGPS